MSDKEQPIEYALGRIEAACLSLGFSSPPELKRLLILIYTMGLLDSGQISAEALKQLLKEV